MSRSCSYRREVSEACNWHQDQALNSTIYILYQTGPTGFLLKEDGEAKNFKVFLGDIHKCDCPVFKKEKDLCKHICWILLKKFRVSRDDPLSWQLGLNEREINQILRGDTAQQHQQQQQTRSKALSKKIVSNDTTNPNEIEQRPITEADICPICQDELLAKKLPVTHCRLGCGNNVHIKCMKVWADHQKTNGETKLKCPLCRETFSTFELLDQEFRNNNLFKTEKPDLHYGLICKSCQSTPISGKCYKCTSCNELYLCQACFNTDFHKQHSFVYREKINQKYRKAARDHVGQLPQAITQSLLTRELNDHDYDLLLQLDSRLNANNNNNNEAGSNAAGSYSQIPEKVIKSWPSERIRENSLLLSPGFQCRICLRAFQVNQTIRKLPSCKHKFHIDCIDNWLIHSHPTCPIDGQIVWDPITAQLEKEEKLNQKSSFVEKKNESKVWEVPTLGLIINYKTCVIENKPPRPPIKNDLLNTNSGLLYSNKLILNKKPLIQKPLHNTDNRRSSSSSTDSRKRIKNASPLNIEVEGRNLSANLLENLDNFTKELSIANGFTFGINRQETENIRQQPINSKKALKPIKSLVEQPQPNSIPHKTEFSTIEIKGNKLEKQTSSTTSLSNMSNMPTTSFLASYQQDFQSFLYTPTDLTNDTESSNYPTKNTPNDVFNVSSMLKAKPYQLTNFNFSTKNSKTSDFDKKTLESVDAENESTDIQNISRFQLDLVNHKRNSIISEPDQTEDIQKVLSTNSAYTQQPISAYVLPNNSLAIDNENLIIPTNNDLNKFYDLNNLGYNEIENENGLISADTTNKKENCLIKMKNYELFNQDSNRLLDEQKKLKQKSRIHHSQSINKRQMIKSQENDLNDILTQFPIVTSLKPILDIENDNISGQIENSQFES